MRGNSIFFYSCGYNTAILLQHVMISSTLRLCSLLLFLALTSCSQSLVYSPASHVAEKQLQAQQVDFSVGVGMLPETRPLKNLDDATFGGTAAIGYGFTDAFNLTLSGWNVLAKHHANRGGMALSSRVHLANSAGYELFLYPRAALLFDGNEVNGYGVELPINVLKAWSPAVYSYAGVGIAYGTKAFQKETNSKGESAMPHGYGIIGHVGIGWNITSQLRLTGEVNPIYQINGFDDTNNAVVVPSISVGYTPAW